MSELTIALKKYWGFDGLRALQEEAINSLMQKKDVVVLLPTGGGKSLCYQLPAVAQPGLAIVVSPLISLMQDQVAQLADRKVKALHLSGMLTQRALDQRLTNAANGGYKLLYISPERLQSEWILERLQQMEISFVAVDEAHCISQWGYDFRPSYLTLKKLREYLPELPIMALTASATPAVLSDIGKELLLNKPHTVRGSFFRTNLAIGMVKSERKEARLMAILQKTKGSAIVYIRSRKGTEQLARFLTASKISAAHYHAGMSPDERQAVQQAWMVGKTRVMVATTAFGMGIDKADVRVVIHMDLPDSPESYYQEIGRAGRDGNPSKCYLLYNEADKNALLNGYKDEPDLLKIKQIYTAFCGQEQLAVGAGQFVERPFNIYPFSAKYGFASRHVHQAFSLLDRSGYLKYEDVSSRPSVFVFTINESDLYKFQVKNPSLEPVIKALLRLYGGITVYPTDINEELVSRKTGMPVERVIKHLEIFTKRSIAFYKKRYRGTTIMLLQPRQPDKHLVVPNSLLKLRVEGKKRRAEAMVAIVENNAICRMQQLVAYFNEESSKKCGICDACIKANVDELTIKISGIIKEPKALYEIANALPDVPRNEVAEALKILLKRGAAETLEDGTVKTID